MVAVSFQKNDTAEATRLAVERLARQPRGHTASDAFMAWASRFVAAEEGEKARLVDEGITLATARRIELKSLIVTAPRTAIENAVPPVVRQLLPRAIAERLEERVNEQAFFGVLGALPGAGSEVGPPVRREVKTSDGGVYRAFVYGRRAEQVTTTSASIVGVAVDNYLAVDERPLRTVEAGEIPNHPNNNTRRRTLVPVDAQGFAQDKVVREEIAPQRNIVQTCPISGKSTSAPQREDSTAGSVEVGQPVVEAGGQFHFLCSGGHILAVEEGIIAAEGGNGGPRKPLSAPAATQSTGYKTNLLMRVAFPESQKPSVSEKEGHDLGKGVQDWMLDTSFGVMTFMTTVTPTIIMPRTEAWYANADATSAGQVLTDARVASKAAGYDPANYDFDTVIFTGSPGSFGGQAYVGGKGCWLKSGTGVGVACHEYGHNFSLWHANFWNTSGVSVIGTGTHVEYGDSFDTMGSASAGDYQFNSYQKNLLNWTPTAVVSNVGASGTYRIYQMDQPTQDPALRYALKIRKDSDRDYWVDLRQKFTSNAWVQGGVFLHWSPWLPSASGSHLLDATPGSPDDKTDAPLVIGRTFSDVEAGIHITPTAKYATVPPSMDVVVNLGAFAGNSAPTMSLAASSTTVAANAVITFTATANDADGDALSYAWDFGDKSFSTANTAVVTKSWSTAGEYAVRCVVSDMKGGTGAATVVVRVGSPTVYRVTGTITLGGVPQANVRVHNGLTGTSYRGSFTNSDGTYAIANLSAGTYTIGAALDGYTYSATGSASVTVSPNGVVNFTATDATRVSINVTDNVVSEGADTGTIRLTRTGPTTSALAVSLYAPTGSATKTTDYTISPDVVSVSPFYTFTIPAGSATLDVTLTAVVDATVEGTEFAVFELVPGTGYTLGTAIATVAIGDAAGAKPLVRMTTPDSDASESGATGQFLIERTGSTAASLAVTVALTGTATNGTDYTTIPTALTIPAGSATAAVNVTPIADSAIEGAETVILTISANATLYNRAASSADYSGTVTISDANLPTLTVVATDASASEALNDPGVFVVTRTGSTAAALTVNYGLTGSALHGTDYVPIPGQLTIPAGSAVGSVVITPIDDGIGEPTQTVVMQLRIGSGYIVGPQSNATVNIVDNGDVPYASISVTAGPAKESGTVGTFKITTTGTGTGNITVLYTVTGTATNGVDYTALSGSVSMGKNTTSSFNVTPIQDLIAEGYETVTVTLTPDAGYSLALDSAATLYIEDDEAPQVNVSTTDVAFTEAAGQTAHFFISRTGSTTAALTVNYTMSGTATSGTDYTAPTGSVVIAAAATGAYVDLPILADALLEGTETITLDVTPDAAYVLGFGSATHYLADAQSLALTTSFSVSTSTVAESVGTTNLTVTLSAASTAPVTVDAVINGGTGLAGADYTFAPQTITFAIGETSKTIPVTILDDTLDEPSETVVIKLVNAIGARIVTATHTITITDDDTPPPVSVGFAALTASGLESVSPAQIIVVLSNPQASAVTVDFAATGGTATNGTDYTITAGTLTFAAGETAKVLPNTITNDTTLEPAETIIVTLSNVTSSVGAVLSANTTHTYTITDDDDVIVSLAASVASAAEPATNGQFTLTRTGPTTGALTVALTITGTATSGADYTAIPATATIAIGASSVNVPVTVLDDALGEGSETVIATIAAGAYTIGTPSTGTVTIADNEPSVSILASDANAAEAALDPGTLMISRTGSTTAALTVSITISGTATNGTDYATLATPAIIPAGSNSVALTVTPIDDTTQEGTETVIVTLNAGAYLISGSPSATVNIVDDDINYAPVITLISPTTSNVTIPLAVGLFIEATATDDGKPVSPGVLTTTWTKVSGPGTVTFDNAATPTTGAVFSASGVYVLRLTANDGAIQVTKDLTVNVDTFSYGDIGAVGVAGSYSEAGGVYTVSGSGTSVTSGSKVDQCFFIRQKTSGTSWDAIVRLTSRTTPSTTSTRCGIMARSGTATGAMSCFMSITSDGRASFIYRTAADTNSAKTTDSATGSLTVPRWLRLARSGNALTGYYSADGITWTQHGTITFAIGDPVLVGLAVVSAVNSTLATATFDNVSIVFPDNTAPLVNAGPAASATLPQYAALDGTASDDALPAASALTTTWVKASGPGTVSFADSAALATTASFSTPGSYVLRLIADDGAVKTYDDTTASATLPVLTISATTPTANEAGPIAGEFTITRAGSSDFTLATHYTIGGTATNGTDYATLASALDIPIGASSATLAVQPVLDTLVEGNETVLLTLSPDAAYTLGTSTSATVTLADAPIVSLIVSDSTATESGPTTGTYTVSRTGSTASALTVSVSSSGTATSGSDYFALTSSITIPIGASSSSVTLTPIADTLAEGPETATLTLATSASYATINAAGTITIADLPIDDWRFAKYGINANTAAAADTANPANDGLNNLLKYAMNLDPLTAALAPQSTIESGMLTLTYRRNLLATDITFTLQESTTLSAWSTAAPTEEILSDDGLTRVIKAKVPVGTAPAKYLRLRAQRP